jgi:hypothetical protein
MQFLPKNGDVHFMTGSKDSNQSFRLSLTSDSRQKFGIDCQISSFLIHDQSLYLRSVQNMLSPLNGMNIQLFDITSSIDLTNLCTSNFLQSLMPNELEEILIRENFFDSF